MQRSRFCNTAALRDAMLFKTYRNTKALLVCMMILTIGFTAFITVGEGNTMHFDVGVNQMLGLFLFGIGMVLAGACTVSTWVKAGEGNVGAIWALLFTFIGMFLFSLIWSFSYWPPAPGSMDHLPHLEALQFGYANAATLQEKTGIPAIFFGLFQTLMLFGIYRAILRKEARIANEHASKQAATTPSAVAAGAPGQAKPGMATAEQSA
ncbi:MAG: YeeE/YedE thiosulfate transporter family protein [Gammaproteobacteria bacterium]